MNIFKRKKQTQLETDLSPAVISVPRNYEESPFGNPSMEYWEKDLYDKLRFTVPVIDAAISKIVRLTGGYKIQCRDERYQELMDNFSGEIPVGLTGHSIQSFTDCFLESLLTYGNAAGEMLIDENTMELTGLYSGDPSKIAVLPGDTPDSPVYCIKRPDGKLKTIESPRRILFAALNPPPGKTMGVSVLRGLPALSSVLMKIYRCIGSNYERAGNVRYAVTYKPSGDISEKAFTKDRAMQIAKEWSDGMAAAKNGEIRDFVAVGDVDIKVIGADNQLFDTEVPVRQILEQLIAKLSVPPFLLGLNWSTTERMSSQQADILTSELEYYRRLLNPVIRKIAVTFLMLQGADCDVDIIWDNINLQDETALAEARLKNAQAAHIERELEEKNNN
ncbi:serine/threonine protein phosphatase [Porcipelethomonas sp.]|uniref:serine/threonine protein phosphatase n=1 Tax=Porcipelethomonas sp. TaxID=2981675 RepID=UPI003EF6876E